MKLSELIARLAEMLEEHGDVEVWTCGNRGPVKDVEFDEVKATVRVE